MDHDEKLLHIFRAIGGLIMFAVWPWILPVIGWIVGLFGLASQGKSRDLLITAFTSFGMLPSAEYAEFDRLSYLQKVFYTYAIDFPLAIGLLLLFVVSVFLCSVSRILPTFLGTYLIWPAALLITFLPIMVLMLNMLGSVLYTYYSCWVNGPPGWVGILGFIWLMALFPVVILHVLHHTVGLLGLACLTVPTALALAPPGSLARKQLEASSSEY